MVIFLYVHGGSHVFKGLNMVPVDVSWPLMSKGQDWQECDFTSSNRLNQMKLPRVNEPWLSKSQNGSQTTREQWRWEGGFLNNKFVEIVLETERQMEGHLTTFCTVSEISHYANGVVLSAWLLVSLPSCTQMFEVQCNYGHLFPSLSMN